MSFSLFPWTLRECIINILDAILIRVSNSLLKRLMISVWCTKILQFSQDYSSFRLKNISLFFDCSDGSLIQNLACFVLLWLVMKVTRSVYFQIWDWISVKAPTSSILNSFYSWLFTNISTRKLSTLNWKWTSFPNCLIITSSHDSCYPKSVRDTPYFVI